MKKLSIPVLLVLIALLIATAVIGQAEALPEGGAWMVNADGHEVSAADPLAAWQTGEYLYVKLGGKTEAFADMSATDEIWVDLNGHDLTVGGSGKLHAFDSANDTYDASKCATLTNTGSVDIQTDVTNPFNGNRYLAVTEGNTATFHRLNMKIESVKLRTSEPGIYYEARYQCDADLAKTVHSYGVILSLNNMPGADFENDPGDVNIATALSPDATFGNGTLATSCVVRNIMRENQASLINNRNGQMKIYANPYIRLNTADGPVVVGDTDNVGKTESSNGFSSRGYSLQTVMKSFDDNYLKQSENDKETVENFYNWWKDLGMNWSFNNIGKQGEIDNGPLQFTEGKAMCPVCKESVTWTELKSSDSALTLPNGGHYYLAEEEVILSVSKDISEGAVIAPGAGKACLHLNGKTLKATSTRAIFGNSGTLNVMGTGTVIGSRDQTGHADAVQLNNSSGGVINLWGGTYLRNGTKGNVLRVAGGGGTINVYKDVTIGVPKPGENYDSIRIGMGKGNENNPNVTTDNGVIVLNGVDMSGGTIAFTDPLDLRYKENILKLVDAKVGTIKMNHCDTVELWGNSQVTNLQMNEDAKLTLGDLKAGALIGITADGVFTCESEKAEAYQKYFTPVNSYCTVELRDNALYCVKKYAEDLTLDGNKAPCLLCEKNAQWQPFVAGERLTAGGHYYLTGNVTYDGTVAAVLAPESGNACLHLNGHDLTATAAPAILGSSGTVNVMGTGKVTGYAASANQGSAVYFDTTVSGGTVNLYGGTYQQATGTAAGAYTIAVPAMGGTVNVYENAQVLSGVTGKAIRIADTASKAVAGVGLYGTKVTGEIYLEGATYASRCSALTIDNTTVDGSVLVNGTNKVTLDHAPVIKHLELSRNTELILERLTEGADITVRTVGKFTEEHVHAQKYAAYFTPYNKVAEILVENNILSYKVDYETGVNLAGGTTAYCPVCEKNVQWTELVKNADGTVKTLDANSHYYLAANQTFDTAKSDSVYAFVTAPSSGTACLYLNGHKLHATNVPAIYSNNGVLNVMGKGEVAGYSSTADTGTAVQTNNSANGSAINLYSGTYTKYTGSNNSAAIVAVSNAGTVNIYEDAILNAGTGKALYLGATSSANAKINLDTCEITGDVSTKAATEADGFMDSILSALNTTIHGTVSINGTNNVVSFAGKTVIDQLNVAEGLLVDFVDMLEGSSVKVSATGVFTPVIGEADHYVAYFSTDDTGDWIICRGYQLTQDAIPAAGDTVTDKDKQQLDDLYNGRTPYHGELHNHSNTDGADGNYSLKQWLEHMEAKRIDFAAIVDHKQSTHMYKADWDSKKFIGGSEPAAPNLLGSEAVQAAMHYNMIFADAEKFEEHLKSIKKFNFTAKTDGAGNHIGGNYSYVNFTVEEMEAVVKSVWDHGGFYVHVHPKFDSYMISEDPLDYWFGDNTGIEITTTDTSKYTMAHKDNVEAYELWVDLLERDRRVFATIGNDNHKLSEVESLTTIYSTEQNAQAFVDYARKGDMTAGPVGIRMSIGNATTGGIASFDGGRLVFSVGNMHTDAYAGVTQYGIELYDEKGIVFRSAIENPKTATTYFAMDTDNARKFYRVVVVDWDTGVRIAVGNPIWNSAYFTMPE